MEYSAERFLRDMRYCSFLDLSYNVYNFTRCLNTNNIYLLEDALKIISWQMKCVTAVDELVIIEMLYDVYEKCNEISHDIIRDNISMFRDVINFCHCWSKILINKPMVSKRALKVYNNTKKKI